MREPLQRRMRKVRLSALGPTSFHTALPGAVMKCIFHVDTQNTVDP